MSAKLSFILSAAVLQAEQRMFNTSGSCPQTRFDAAGILACSRQALGLLVKESVTELVSSLQRIRFIPLQPSRHFVPGSHMPPLRGLDTVCSIERVHPSSFVTDPENVGIRDGAMCEGKHSN